MTSLRTPWTTAQIALYEHMSYISDEYWSAGWMNDLDKRLQGYLDSGNRTPNGLYEGLSRHDFEKLQRLHSAAGGWWVWDDSVDHNGPDGDCVRFVSGGKDGT